jgi:HD-like signal output (HDOD) protein
LPSPTRLFGFELPPELADILYVLSELTAHQLTQHLEGEVRARVDSIDASLPAAYRTPDVLRVLQRVRESQASTIRPAPAAAQRALAKTRNPDISINQLVQVIEDDPTLCQGLLKYANSAYYNTTGTTIVSLKSAAQRIGTTGVHNVVLSTMVDGMMCKPGGNFEGMVEQVRSHMVRTAPLARALARGFAVPPDDAFALALLHDVGKLIIFDIIGDVRYELRRDVVLPESFARHLLMSLHGPLGGVAALRWSLGNEAALAIATHHRESPPTDEVRMSELLFIAERAEHALNGVRTLDFDGWWEEGAIAGAPNKTYELFGTYSASEVAA